MDERCAVCNRDLSRSNVTSSFGNDGYICETCNKLNTNECLSHLLDTIADFHEEARIHCGGKSNARRAVLLMMNSPALRNRLAEMPEDGLS